MRSLRRPRPDPRVVYQVASWCLDYPTVELVERLPLFAERPGRATGCAGDRRGSTAWSTTSAAPRSTACSAPTSTSFDLSRKHALYLSYWTDGDTRRRGEVLGRFKSAYRASGFLVDTHGELPDYLPMVLEFAARADLAAGRELLQAYRPSLELLRIALRREAESVCGCARRRVRDASG